MNFNIGSGGLVKVITVFEGYTEIKESKELYDYIAEKDLFKANCGDIYSDVSYHGENIILLGLGKEEKLTSNSITTAFHKLGKELMKLKVTSIDINLGEFKNCSYKKSVLAIVEGLLESEYKFEQYITKKTIKPTVKDVYINVPAGQEDDAKSAIDTATLLMDSVCLARNLVNEPAMRLTPKKLALLANDELKPLGVKVDIHGRDEISELGMKAFLAVSKGSAQEPQLIIMKWAGDPDSDDTIALVGKGLTYDSGGYSLKSSNGMEEMKSDMAGSAAVIGAMKAIATSKVKKNVVAIVAACENLISGAAYKPGDIVRSMSGKTIEILNTDAEGRLTLADALWYAVTVEKADKVIDIATLTGACVVALGDLNSGAVTNNDEFMSQVKKASEVANEGVWQMPSNPEYKKEVKGTFADLRNTGGSNGGGMITAGLFLEEFVDGTPWVHLDIAGTSYFKNEKGYLPKGATGVSVKTLYYLVTGHN